MPAIIDEGEKAEFAWQMSSVERHNPSAGSTPSRHAHRYGGNVQPAMSDPWIAKKHTYRESKGQVTASMLFENFADPIGLLVRQEGGDRSACQRPTSRIGFIARRRA